MKTYASIAQAEYRDGMWTGSLGLVSRTFRAKGKRAAQLSAKRFYIRQWKRAKSKTMKLKKLHVSVEEAWYDKDGQAI